MQRSLTAQNDLEILSMINGLRRPLYRCHWIVIRSDEMSDDLLRLDANEITRIIITNLSHQITRIGSPLHVL